MSSTRRFTKDGRMVAWEWPFDDSGILAEEHECAYTRRPPVIKYKSMRPMNNGDNGQNYYQGTRLMFTSIRILSQCSNPWDYFTETMSLFCEFQRHDFSTRHSISFSQEDMRNYAAYSDQIYGYREQSFCTHDAGTGSASVTNPPLAAALRAPPNGHLLGRCLLS